MKASSRSRPPGLNEAGVSVASTRPLHQRQPIAALRLVHEMGGHEDGDALIARRSISSSQNWSRASGSTPDVGSSRINSSGSCTTATASDRRCLIPSGRQRPVHRDDRRGRHGPTSSAIRSWPAAADGKARVQIEVLADRELAIERKGLRHVADAPARLDIACLGRLAEQQRLALRRRQQTRQHLHGRGLAPAVRADKAEDFSAAIEKFTRSTAVKSPNRQVRLLATMTGSASRSGAAEFSAL